MNWSPDPFWGRQDGDLADERTCTRCSGTIAPQHRHFWPGCSSCAIWSFLGTQVATWLGVVGAREFMYWGARPDCPTCFGEGYLPCEDQDLSILRRSGACSTCGSYSFELVGSDGVIEGSGRHYDDLADHPVAVRAMPLVGALDEHLTRTTPPLAEVLGFGEAPRAITGDVG